MSEFSRTLQGTSSHLPEGIFARILAVEAPIRAWTAADHPVQEDSVSKEALLNTNHTNQFIIPASTRVCVCAAASIQYQWDASTEVMPVSSLY